MSIGRGSKSFISCQTGWILEVMYCRVSNALSHQYFHVRAFDYSIDAFPILCPCLRSFDQCPWYVQQFYATSYIMAWSLFLWKTTKKLDDTNVYGQRFILFSFCVLQVRYQNRNRVADQRSIGGQFVRKDPGSSDYRKHLTWLDLFTTTTVTIISIGLFHWSSLCSYVCMYCVCSQFQSPETDLWCSSLMKDTLALYGGWLGVNFWGDSTRKLVQTSIIFFGIVCLWGKYSLI